MIKTTEELFNYYKEHISLSEGHYDYLIYKEDFKEALLEFAKAHTQEALEKAYENVEYSTEFDTRDNCCYVTIDKDSILNAYNIEENIK